MIGCLDTPEDWEATAWCLALGLKAHGQEAKTFLLGHRAGFLLGRATEKAPHETGHQAYLRVRQQVVGL